jgi:hypothetical protein
MNTVVDSKKTIHATLYHMQCYHHLVAKILKIHSGVVYGIFIARIIKVSLLRTTYAKSSLEMNYAILDQSNIIVTIVTVKRWYHAIAPVGTTKFT